MQTAILLYFFMLAQQYPNLYLFTDAGEKRVAANRLVRKCGFCIDPTMRSAFVFKTATLSFEPCTCNDASATSILQMRTNAFGEVLYVDMGKFKLCMRKLKDGPLRVIRNDMFGEFLTEPESISPAYYELRLPFFQPPVPCRNTYRFENGVMISNGIQNNQKFEQTLLAGATVEKSTGIDVPFETGFVLPIATDTSLCDFTWAKEPDAYSPYFFHGVYAYDNLRNCISITFVQSVLHDEPIILQHYEKAQQYLYIYEPANNFTLPTLHVALLNEDNDKPKAPKRARVDASKP